MDLSAIIEHEVDNTYVQEYSPPYVWKIHHT